VRVAAAPLHHRLTCCTLEWRKPEDAPAIVLENELDQTIAKATDPVVENEMHLFDAARPLNGGPSHV
jgi:hypothetical protein